jgi:predicted  nucleic acid-binding Zn-ribbon protein
LPRQPDLLAINLDDVQPEGGRNGPRLWVRRLVIWRAVGDVIRDIPLKPGLNIVWSPDSGRPNEPMGHGGGKTSFCRLLRYCLGEDSYGSHFQRELIANHIPDGHVGAEVMLDGVQWGVIRPIGIGNRHYCAEGIELDTAFSSDMPNTSIMPLRKAITSALMNEAANRMPLARPRDDAWEAALAWLTRDQECRLRHPLDWRAAQTQSRSPSRQRQLSDTDRLVIVRLLINALRADETTAAEAARKLRDEIEAARARQRRLEWLINDLREGLMDAFGGEAENPATQHDFWGQQATSKLTATKDTVPPDLTAKLRQARQDKAKAENNIRAIDGKISVIDGRLTEKDNLKRVVDNNRAKAHTHVADAQNPVCKTCGRRLDAVAIAFIAERQQEADDASKGLDNLVAEIGVLRREQESLKHEREVARQSLTALSSKIEKLEEQSAKLAEALGHVTMTTRYVRHLAELERGTTTIAGLTARIAAENQKIAELRRSSQDVISRLSQLFDASLRFLVPDNVQGAITLDEDGLHLSLHVGGERSTAAVDSLKIVAFDLAALLLTIEGRTQLPAFLIHDSPREADLGRSIYNRLFELGQKMEEFGSAPLFQYIVTTTTAPPEPFRNDQWVKLELHGAPREQRLFMEDL